MMYSILDPKNDFVFKNIFGTEKNSDILISFLNAVIKPEKPINKIEIKNTDISKEYEEDKYSILDVKALTNNNERINIEIQLRNEYDMIKRSLYYWSKLYTEKLSEGDKYETLERTVCINILNFKYLETEKFHSIYRLKETSANKELTDVEEIHFIEIPKLEETEVDDLSIWIEFLKNPNSIKVIDAESSMKEIQKAKKELVRISNDEKARAIYDMREKARMDKISAMATAKQQGKIEVAKNLIDVLDDEAIALATGLDINIIKELRKSI